MMRLTVGLGVVLVVSFPALGRAQTAPLPGQFPVAQPAPVAQPGVQPFPIVQPQYLPVSNTRSATEITVLYSTAAVYGVGVGVWFGSEAHIKDPGLFLIAPAIL